MTYSNDLTLTLPVAENYPILLITGDALRHERFAMRMHAEFPRQIVGWLQLVTSHDDMAEKRNQLHQERPSLRGSARRVRTMVARLLRQSPNGTREPGDLGSSADASRSRESLLASEKRLFGKEVERLKRNGNLLRPITVDNLESEAALARIERLNPYFILTFCNSTCIASLRKRFTGMILSQSDVSNSEFGASSSVYWALYHRDLSRIVSNIRLWHNGNDAGIVVRSSTPCLAVDDTPETCFVRESALGTELMCEVVGGLLKTRSVRLDGCQMNDAAEMDPSPAWEIRREVAGDLRKGLIKREVARKMTF